MLRLLISVVALALPAAPASGQTSLGVGDLDWTLVLANPDDVATGVAEIDPREGTLEVWPSDVGCFCQREARFMAVSPFDGTVTATATTVAHDSLQVDQARFYVGDHFAVITTSTGAFPLSFEVFAGVPFGLGAMADDCCGTLQVVYDDFELSAASVTPTTGAALDVRVEAEAAVPATSEVLLATVGDLDGDGYTDLAWRGASSGFQEPAELHALSGVDLSPLWSVVETSSILPNALAAAGDVDLDGVPDVLVSGTAAGVSVRSGADGSEITTVSVPGLPFARPDEAEGAGDTDLDGRQDLWLLHGATLWLVSGSGAVLHESTFPGGSAAHWRGDALARLADVDGDGIDDVIAGASTPSGTPRVLVVSGGSGLVLQEHVGAPSSALGHAVADAGDVDGDGVHDILAGAPGALDGKGQAHVWSGADGALIHRFSASEPLALGTGVAGAGDVDADGHADVLLGTAPPESVTLQPDGRVELRSGADKALLHAFTRAATFDFGRALAGGLSADAAGAPRVATTAGRGEPGDAGAVVVLGDLALAYGAASLSATGTLQPGTPYTLELTGGPPASLAFLVIGLSMRGTAFKGGVLVPSPDVVAGVPLDGGGGVTLGGDWPGSVPARTLLAFQMWLPDTHGPAGFGASNGVLFLVP